MTEKQPAESPCAPFASATTAEGLRVACYRVALDAIPVDFFADPDGLWSFESLARAAGFRTDEGVAIGALRRPFGQHPDGAAVVTLNSEQRPYVAIIECPIAFSCVDAQGASLAGAA
ncbi:MAG TPA: hypothetical protein VFQ35_03905 [Polyangiaceae bacterium]|nr:hypothetical protein [Polyangiaceae bacterium]